MFHVEHKTLLLWAVSILSGTAQLAATPVASSPESCLILPLATTNRESAACVASGMQELLLGDNEAAGQYFARAIDRDENPSPLAYIGLYMTQGDAAALDALTQRLDSLPVTPPEAFYLESLLLLVQRDIDGAQEAFSARAERYRADLFSACWAVQLLHYREQGYIADGGIQPYQQQALEQASALYRRYPDNPIVCYQRALVEENAPIVSDEALAAARRAVELLPDHPTVSHLLGHLLYKRGDYEEAARVFHSVWEMATQQQKEIVALQARLYESVALWSAGKDKEALAIRRELNAMPLTGDSSSTRNIFLIWESHTLPLRILVLRAKAPQQSEINAAVRTAIPDKNVQQDNADAYQVGVLCLQDALRARSLAAQKKKQDALAALQSAESRLCIMEKGRGEFLRKHPYLLTPWERLHDACVIAVNTARAELYPSTSETWREHVQSTSAKPSDMQLPPCVPQQGQN